MASGGVYIDGDSDAENDYRAPISGPHDYVSDVTAYVRADMARGLEETPCATYDGPPARKGDSSGMPIKRPVEGLFHGA